MNDPYDKWVGAKFSLLLKYTETKRLNMYTNTTATGSKI